MTPSEQVRLGRTDEVYRCCRLVALAEKEILATVMADISDAMQDDGDEEEEEEEEEEGEEDEEEEVDEE